IRRWRYNLIPAESKFKTPCSIIKDKYMMKAQVHVSKSSAISDIQALPRRKYFYYQVVNTSHTKKIFANMRRIEGGFSEPRRKQRKEAEVSHDESKDEDHVPTPSSDPLPNGEDIFILNELMVFCTSLQKQKVKIWRALEIEEDCFGRKVKSPIEKDGLGAQKNASKQGRMIAEIDQNVEIALDDETQERTNDDCYLLNNLYQS
nr:hypothetical protein [Tanacetum cinerariifolium]